MTKLMLSDEQWERIRHHFPEKSKPKGSRGRPPVSDREAFDAVLWTMYSGAPWDLLPQCYPDYKTVRKRYQTWVRTGVLESVVKDLEAEADSSGLVDEDDGDENAGDEDEDQDDGEGLGGAEAEPTSVSPTVLGAGTLEKAKTLAKKVPATEALTKAKALAVRAHDGSQAVLGSSAAVLNSSLSKLVEGVPTAVDRAMDANYLATHIGGGMHRMFDGGHTLWGATKAALSTDDGIVTQATDLVRGLARDVTTPAGLPFFNWDKATYDTVANFLKDNIGLPKKAFAELMSYTAADVLAGLLGGAQLAFRWTDGETKDFVRIATTTGAAAMIQLNPIVAVVSVAALAKAFNEGRKDGWDGVAGECVKGAATMAVAPVVMAAGGPASVAVVASIITTMALDHLSPAAGKEARQRMKEIRTWLAERRIGSGSSDDSAAVALVGEGGD